MPTGPEFYNMLDQRSKDICVAMDELNAVITGGTFNKDTLIWPDSDLSDGVAHAAGIGAAMAAIEVTDNLESAIDKLFAGLEGGAINDAIEAATNAIQQVLTEASQLNDELGVGDRVDAFNELNEPASGPRADKNFGYIPAIEGVINAAANSNVDLDDALGPIKAIGAAIAAGAAYTIFAAYATGTVEMLNKSLRVGTPR